MPSHHPSPSLPTHPIRVLSRKFLLGGGEQSIWTVWERGACSERKDFAERTERCNRPISYQNALPLLSFGSSIKLTSKEKVSVHWGRKNIIHKIFFFGGGGGGGGGELFKEPSIWLKYVFFLKFWFFVSQNFSKHSFHHTLCDFVNN